MICECGGTSHVINSARQKRFVRGRLECNVCGNRWNTMESVLVGRQMVQPDVAVKRPQKPSKTIKRVDKGKQRAAVESLSELFDEDINEIKAELGITDDW